MTQRRNPNFLKKYVEIAHISEAPDYMHFWAGVSLLASIVQRKVYLPMGTFEFVPNFYIIFVTPPGISKSVTIAPVADFLRHFTKQGVYLSKASTTWQEFIQSLGRATTSVEYPDSGGMRLHYNAMSILASELGTFLDFSNHDLINHLTELWDARKGKFEKGTKTQGVDTIYSPVLNMLGGTTPAWIERNFETFMIGSGFTSRTIFIYAPQKAQYITYPALKAKEVGFNLEQWRHDLLYDLRIIANLKGHFTLNEGALEFGEGLYERIQDKINSGELTDDLQGFYARKQGHIHKLAMLIAISERDNLIITESDLARAEEIITLAETSRIQTLASVGHTRESKVIADVKRMLAQMPNKQMRIEDVWRRLTARNDKWVVENALNSGQRAGFWLYQNGVLKAL